MIVTFKRVSSGSGNFILCDMHSQWEFLMLSMNDLLLGCLFAVVVIKCFMIGVNV